MFVLSSFFHGPTTCSLSLTDWPCFLRLSLPLGSPLNGLATCPSRLEQGLFPRNSRATPWAYYPLIELGLLAIDVTDKTSTYSSFDHNEATEMALACQYRRWLLWSQFLSTPKLTTSHISIQISFGKDSNPVNKPRQVLEICFFISHPSTNSLPRLNLRIKCEQLCPKKRETVWDWSLEESVLTPRINR